MTDRLGAQVAWSVAFAAVSAVVGYVLAGYGPLCGSGRATRSARRGMIATVSGLILAIAALAGPRRRPLQPRG